MAQQKNTKNGPDAEKEQKVQTRYDLKMEKRKQQKLKEARQEKITKVIASIVVIALVAAVVISVAASVIRKSSVLHGTYVRIGDHELSELEYDYFYNSTVNNYLMSYSSILPYMGLDTSVDFDQQQYTEELTWKDMFDEMTVEQIKQTKALVDDAQKAGFVHDTTAEYAQYQEELKEYAASDGMSVKEYYTQSFGPYATEKNMESLIREGMLANAYYNEQLVVNAPSDEEIRAYYEENKQSYDRVDYRSFYFDAGLEEDADEDTVNKAMEELQKKAQAMLDRRKAGEDFEALCIENASEEAKADYEDEETEHCLSEGRTYAGVAAVMADWLFADERREGDITVLEDEASHRYYVVEFSDRYYDEADDENISNTIAGQRTSDYIAGLVENYQVEDVKGKLKYLTVDKSGSETDSAEETKSPGEETDEESSEDAGNAQETGSAEEDAEQSTDTEAAE